MGDEALRDEELAVVNLEHVKRISDTFRPNSVRKNGSIQKTVVQEIWKTRLAPRFYSALMNVMFPGDAKEVSFLSFYTIYKNLAEPEAEIVFRALTIYHIATIHEPPFNYEQADEYPNAPFMNIKAYVCDVITSYLHAIIHINMKEPLGWLELKASNGIMEGNLVAAYLLKDLEAHRNEVSIGSLEIWLEKSEIYYTVSVELYLYLFGVNKTIDVKSLVPFPIVQTGKNSRTLMSLPDVLLLNSKLPKRAPRWTLAFMLDSRTGDWEKFKQAIYGKGQTLIVIQDSNGDIFGMYGSQQWVPSTGFYGNDQSFLFTLKPDVNVYESSGRNNNFQIFTETGIGMGGSEDNFGLFVNYGAKTGKTSLSCDTFRQFWPLARELDFTIVQIEIWTVSQELIAAPVEVVALGGHGDQETKFDLLSEKLSVAKLTTDFIKNDLLENKSMKGNDNNSKTTLPGSMGTTQGNNEGQLLKTIFVGEEKKSDATSVVQEALQKQSEIVEDGQPNIKVITPATIAQNSGFNVSGESSHFHRCVGMSSEKKLSKRKITTGNNGNNILEEIVGETKFEADSVVQKSLHEQSELVKDGHLTNKVHLGSTGQLNGGESGTTERKLSRMGMAPEKKDDKVREKLEMTSEENLVVHGALEKQIERGKNDMIANVIMTQPTDHNEEVQAGMRSHGNSCRRMHLKRNLLTMEITTCDKDYKVTEGIVEETSQSTAGAQDAQRKLSERGEDGTLSNAVTPRPTGSNSGDEPTSKRSHAHSYRRTSSQRKLARMEKVAEEKVGETKSESTSVVQESLQKRSEVGEARQSTKDSTACGPTEQSNDDDSTDYKSHKLYYVRKSNTDFLRPRIADLSNFNSQQGEAAVRKDGYVHPSEGENLGRNPKTRRLHVTADGHDNFIHPSLKPRYDHDSESPKRANSKPRESCGSPEQGIPSNKINDASEDGKSNDVPDIMKHAAYDRIGKNMVDIQVQVGQSKLSPMKYRASGKGCACGPPKKKCTCTAKSSRCCKSSKPMMSKTLLGICTNVHQFPEEQLNPLVYATSSTTVPITCKKFMKKEGISCLLKSGKLKRIEKPIQQDGSYTSSKASVPPKIESLEKNKRKISKEENITKITTVTEKQPPDTVAPQTVTDKMEIDLTPRKDEMKSDSASMIGCRCSSTESSDWDEDGTGEEKFKSGCGCQEKTPLLGDLDVTNNYTSEDVSVIGKPLRESATDSKFKEVSSSLCSCVLGPKDQGARTAPTEKQSTSKDFQQLTQSSKKMTKSVESEGTSAKLNISTDPKCMSHFLEKESQCLTKSSQSRDRTLKPGDYSSSSVTSEAHLSCCRHTKSPKKRSKSEKSTAIPAMFKYTHSPGSSHEKQLGKSLQSERCLTSCITNESLSSFNTKLSYAFQKDHISLEPEGSIAGPLVGRDLDSEDKHFSRCSHRKKLGSTNKKNKVKQCFTNETQKLSANFCTNFPPTCLSCRSLVKQNGCRCKTRSRPKLNPIIEQEELLQQQQPTSDLESISKSDVNSKYLRLAGDTSSVTNKSQGSSIKKTKNIKKDNSKQSLNENSTTAGKTTDVEHSVRVKKSCQCSLPRSCFPQFPEDLIQTDEDVKKCGCGIHGGPTGSSAFIRFPTFNETTEDNKSITGNLISTSDADLTVSQGTSDGSKKKTRVEGTCPCEDEDGTVIILNVSKCNTMQALEKIVQELDVKLYSALPPRLSEPDINSTKPKSCTAPDESEMVRIKRLLESKTKLPSKEPSETKIPPVRE